MKEAMRSRTWVVSTKIVIKVVVFIIMDSQPP